MPLSYSRHQELVLVAVREEAARVKAFWASCTQMWPNGMYALCDSASLRMNDNKIGDIAGFEAKLAAVIEE